MRWFFSDSFDSFEILYYQQLGMHGLDKTHILVYFTQCIEVNEKISADFKIAFLRIPIRFMIELFVKIMSSF